MPDGAVPPLPFAPCEETNAILEPSGDQTGSTANGVSSTVVSEWSPCPFTPIVQIKSGAPGPAVPPKAIDFPSGDQVGRSIWANAPGVVKGVALVHGAFSSH